MEIIPGTYPSFADCSIGSKPSTPLMAFLSRKFSLGMSDVEARGIGLVIGPSSYLFTFGLYEFTLEDTEIHENLSRGRVPIRLAVKLDRPVTSAQVTFTIAPAGK